MTSNADPFAALGDANRREIVELLASGELSVRELADELPISRPAVSRHLKLLKAAGLVSDRAEGVKRIYSLDFRGADEVRGYLESVWSDAIIRYRIAATNTEPPDDADND